MPRHCFVVASLPGISYSQSVVRGWLGSDLLDVQDWKKPWYIAEHKRGFDTDGTQKEKFQPRAYPG